LPSERDQNFLLQLKGSEARTVLKIHNPGDETAFVECQSLALECATVAGANCQRLLRTTDTNDFLVPVPLGEVVCQCRMLEFIPGAMLADAAAGLAGEDRDKLWGDVGRAVGGVCAALLNFEHPAAQRTFHWDLQQCEEVIGARKADVREDRQPLIERFVAQYRSEVVPLLPQLRRSVVHNDGNDYNLVVQEGSRVGVLDFGDMLHSYTVADAAICLAYLLFHCPAETSLVESALPFVTGFHSQCPLKEEEVEALFGLAIMRVCTSVCMSAYQSKLEPDNEYLLVSAGPAWALLERLAAEELAERPVAVFRRACGFEPRAA